MLDASTPLLPARPRSRRPLCLAVTAVSAPFDALPLSVRNLPNGSDLVITFATGSVSTMALNWIANAKRAGVDAVLIGALDAKMMEECERAKQVQHNNSRARGPQPLLLPLAARLRPASVRVSPLSVFV